MTTLKTISAAVFVLIILPLILTAQVKKTISAGRVSGIVRDAKSGESLIAVSVFLSGTTIGCITEGNGHYDINRIPTGQYELIFSMVGYSPVKKTILIEDKSELKIDTVLTAKDVETIPVEVIEKRSPDWYDNLKIFRKGILGGSDFAEDCIIVNEQDLIFLQSANGDSITAHIAKPIIIINNALGYKLTCPLVEYSFAKGTKKDFFKVVMTFEELKPKDARELEEWKDNRWDVYKGSLRHFLVSLVKGKALDEGFGIYKDISLKYTGQKFVSETYLQKLKLGEKSIAVTDEGANGLRFVRKKFSVSYKNIFSQVEVGGTGMSIDESGYPLDDTYFIIGGGWEREGLADLLPRFYERNFEEE